jgi:hypothetical protein
MVLDLTKKDPFDDNYSSGSRISGGNLDQRLLRGQKTSRQLRKETSTGNIDHDARLVCYDGRLRGQITGLGKHSPRAHRFCDGGDDFDARVFRGQPAQI